MRKKKKRGRNIEREREIAREGEKEKKRERVCERRRFTESNTENIGKIKKKLHFGCTNIIFLQVMLSRGGITVLFRPGFSLSIKLGFKNTGLG